MNPSSTLQLFPFIIVSYIVILLLIDPFYRKTALSFIPAIRHNLRIPTLADYTSILISLLSLSSFLFHGTHIGFILILVSLFLLVTVNIFTNNAEISDPGFSSYRLIAPLLLVLILNRISADMMNHTWFSMQLDIKYPHLPINLIFNPIAFIGTYITILVILKYIVFKDQTSVSLRLPYKTALALLTIAVLTDFTSQHLGGGTLPQIAALTGIGFQRNDPLFFIIFTVKFILLLLSFTLLDRVLLKFDQSSIEKFSYRLLLPAAEINIAVIIAYWWLL